MTDTQKQTIVTKLTVKSANERQFGSTTTSWHWIKQAAGFLSLDLKYPHKTKGMHHQISHCKVLWDSKYIKLWLNYCGGKKKISKLLKFRCKLEDGSASNQPCTSNWIRTVKYMDLLLLLWVSQSVTLPLSDFFSLDNCDTYILPAGLKPLQFTHKASQLFHRAQHVIIVSLYGYMVNVREDFLGFFTGIKEYEH